MAKRKKRQNQKTRKIAEGIQGLDQKLHRLIAQRRYSQALSKLRQAQKQGAEQTLSLTEADILRQQGQYEYEQGRHINAETALIQALALDPQLETYQLLAKCYLAQDKPAEALGLFQSAFDHKTLPKHLGGSYLKLLLLNHQSDQVAQLVETQAQRFYAPQLHWARGALALEAGDPQAALTHFKKMGRVASPGGDLSVWPAYAHQLLGDQSAAEQGVGMPPPNGGRFAGLATGSQHLAVQALRLALAAHSGDRRLAHVCDLKQPDLPHRTAAWVLDLLHLLRQDNFHDAAHVFLQFPEEVRADYPELETLYRPLMLLAGRQAREQEEIDCAALFWGKVVQHPEFDPQLAVQLYPVLQATHDDRAVLSLLNQWLTWVQKTAKRTPQAWPESRLSAVQAKLYCWLADCQIGMNRYSEAIKCVRKAEQLDPHHPEVLGRKGLQAFLQDDYPTAISLMTQALEAGCQFREVYAALLKCLQGDRETLRSVRRQYGKRFDDFAIETEPTIPVWVEALSFQYYDVMADFVLEFELPPPPVEALQIFLDSAQNEPGNSQRVNFDLTAAGTQWDELLRSHPPETQIEILKAIYLVIQQHARRNQKGVMAQQARYAQKIFELIPAVPGANLAHLMLLPLKKLSDERLAAAVTAALRQSAQPGMLLAQAQLQLSWFGPNRALAPFVETYLRQDPQNPLLLLAKAALHPRSSPEYETFYHQGFELARRLQDETALEACRNEEWFKAQEMTRQAFGSKLGRNDGRSQAEMLDVIQRLARETLGREVPPELLVQMLPELLEMLGQDNDDFFASYFEREEDDEVEDDLYSFEPDDWDLDNDISTFFAPPPQSRKSSSKRRKPWYEL